MAAALDAHPGAGAVAAVPRRRADFDRPLVCILGLPFDAVDMGQAVERIRTAAFGNERCFVSTPNLNFAIAARNDTAFRDSVLHSDLILVDGMPLVWIARLLGLPVRERVSGADVFEALCAHAGPPLPIYLFGGPPGAAARACEALNRRNGGVRCVGFDEAGFGSIEAMSSDAQIARINDSGARFVVVALGAKKGQAWIEHNAPRLRAPVLSHLGAVVNFAAGTVARAPRWMRALGLEWLWRIKEEPSLWRRYWNDGVGAAAWVLTTVVPDACVSRLPLPRAAPPAALEARREPQRTTLLLRGAWHDDDVAVLRSAFEQCAGRDGRVVVDLAGVTRVSNAVVAALLQARGWFGAHAGFEVVGAGPTVAATLRRKGAARALLDRS